MIIKKKRHKATNYKSRKEQALEVIMISDSITN